jgi:hypothetical protein
MQRYFYMYEKNAKTHYIFLFFQNMIFFRDLAICTQNKTFYIYIFEMRGFVFFFEISVKNRYFNTSPVFYSVSIQS